VLTDTLLADLQSTTATDLNHRCIIAAAAGNSADTSLTMSSRISTDSLDAEGQASASVERNLIIFYLFYQRLID